MIRNLIIDTLGFLCLAAALLACMLAYFDILTIS